MPEYSISIFRQIIYNVLIQTQFFFHFINFNSLVLSSDSFISLSLHSADAHMVTPPTIFSVILSNVFMYVVISFEKTHSKKMSVICKKMSTCSIFSAGLLLKIKIMLHENEVRLQSFAGLLTFTVSYTCYILTLPLAMLRSLQKSQ